MKLLCVIFLALIINHPVFLQKENAFPKVKIYQWENVINAKPDTIFGISFRKSRISSLPKELYQFTNLIYLNLEKNKLQELPENLDTLTKLKYLNISKNKLKIFPLVITRLFELEILVANRNHFERLPNNIKYCSKLKSIDFWNTPVAFLPDGFFKLKNLEKLDLSNIRFSPKQHQKIVNTFGGIDLKLDPPCDCMD